MKITGWILRLLRVHTSAKLTFEKTIDKTVVCNIYIIYIFIYIYIYISGHNLHIYVRLWIDKCSNIFFTLYIYIYIYSLITITYFIFLSYLLCSFSFLSFRFILPLHFDCEIPIILFLRWRNVFVINSNQVIWLIWNSNLHYLHPMLQ